MSELVQMFSYAFMQRALIVGVLVSLCARCWVCRWCSSAIR